MRKYLLAPRGDESRVIVAFPSAIGEAAQRRVAASAVRFAQVAKPSRREAPTLDQRIQWAKETAAGYQDLAAIAERPERKRQMEASAARWDREVDMLIAQRPGAQAALDFDAGEGVARI